MAVLAGRSTGSLDCSSHRIHERGVDGSSHNCRGRGADLPGESVEACARAIEKRWDPRVRRIPNHECSKPYRVVQASILGAAAEVPRDHRSNLGRRSNSICGYRSRWRGRGNTYRSGVALSNEQSNNTFERTVNHRGRAVLAMDYVLGGAQWRRWSAAQLGR